MKAVKLIIRWLVYLAAATLIIRAVTLISGFDVYLTNDPWDWVTLALLLSPLIPLILFIFWGKSQKSILGQVSTAKQVFMPWWMVESENSPIAKVLGRDRPIWQMALWVIIVFFVLLFVVILGTFFIPYLINFMTTQM